MAWLWILRRAASPWRRGRTSRGGIDRVCPVDGDFVELDEAPGPPGLGAGGGDQAMDVFGVEAGVTRGGAAGDLVAVEASGDIGRLAGGEGAAAGYTADLADAFLAVRKSSSPLLRVTAPL